MNTPTAAKFALVLSLLAFGPLAYYSLGQSSPGSPPNPAPAPQAGTMVARVWHGRTRAAQADEYYAYLREAGIEKIQGIAGNLGVQVLRRTTNEVTEFTVISYWESREAIRKFAGADIEKTHNLPKDPQYLLELEPAVAHFDVAFNEWKH